MELEGQESVRGRGLPVLIERLLETSSARVFRRGLKKAFELLQESEEKGVFAWAPSLRYWLRPGLCILTGSDGHREEESLSKSKKEHTRK